MLSFKVHIIFSIASIVVMRNDSNHNLHEHTIQEMFGHGIGHFFISMAGGGVQCNFGLGWEQNNFDRNLITASLPEACHATNISTFCGPSSTRTSAS
jgi:hypothetical protein